MNYAIIDLGGKQFVVTEGTQFNIERQEDNPKAEVVFYKDEKQTLIGQPVLENVEVKLSKARDYTEKTDIFRFKSKSRYRRRQGHKQPWSVVRVDSIKVSNSKTSSVKKSPAKAGKKEEK